MTHIQKTTKFYTAGTRTINLPCPSTCLVVALTEEDLVNSTANIQIDKAQIATSVDANFTIPTNALTQKLITQENTVLLNEYKKDCHNETGSCEEVANIVLLNREKLDNSSLLRQTINSAILDSGASTTVCGKKWLDCFLETLPEDSKKEIPYKEGTKCFKFGDVLKVKLLKKLTLPCVIAKMNIKIISDVVDANIPLLLSKTAMKRARITLNFNNDTVEMFGKRIKLLCTTSGHYHVPISRPPPDRGKLRHILFLNNIDKKGKVEKLKIATKLHKQFSHPSAKRLCDLVKGAGLKDAEFIDILMKLPLTCQTCIRYKKPAPRSVVGFPLGTHFNQTVAMDIKEIK